MEEESHYAVPIPRDRKGIGTWGKTVFLSTSWRSLLCYESLPIGRKESSLSVWDWFLYILHPMYVLSLAIVFCHAVMVGNKGQYHYPVSIWKPLDPTWLVTFRENVKCWYCWEIEEKIGMKAGEGYTQWRYID